MNRAVSITLALILTSLALAYSLWGIDFSSLVAVLATGEYGLYLPFLAGLTVFFVFKAHRWAVILRPLGRFTWPQTFPAMMIGFAGNNILPAHLGEIVRVVVFARQYRKPLSGTFVSLVVERTLDVAAVLCIYIFAVNRLEEDIEVLRVGAWLAGVALLCVCVGMYAFLRWSEVFRRIWRTIGVRFPEPIRARGDWLLTNSVTAIGVLRSLPTLAYLFANSLLQWLIMVALAWLSLFVYGQQISVEVAFLLTAATVLAVTVPSVPGYFGAIQAAFVFALIPFGVTQEAALAASIMFLVGQWIPVTTAGIVFFFTTGFKLSETRKAVEEADHAAN